MHILKQDIINFFEPYYEIFKKKEWNTLNIYSENNPYFPNFKLFYLLRVIPAHINENNQLIINYNDALSQFITDFNFIDVYKCKNYIYADKIVIKIANILNKHLKLNRNDANFRFYSHIVCDDDFSLGSGIYMCMYVDKSYL